MRRVLMVAAGLALMAASVFSAPAQAMPIAAPALQAASDGLAVTEKVGCWNGDCDGGYGYGGGYGYRRSYYGYGGGYGYGYGGGYGYG
jgi:hypothetical protein